jgi:hypothetical protein
MLWYTRLNYTNFYSHGEVLYAASTQVIVLTGSVPENKLKKLSVLVFSKCILISDSV